jgi:hypothetical protein
MKKTQLGRGHQGLLRLVRFYELLFSVRKVPQKNLMQNFSFFLLK